MDTPFQPIPLRLLNDSMCHIKVDAEIMKLIETRLLLKLTVTEYTCRIYSVNSRGVTNILKYGDKIITVDCLHMLGKYAHVEFRVI